MSAMEMIRDWWRHRRMRATDLEIAAAGDTAYILGWAKGRRFKQCIEIECDRDELLLLGDMIRDYADDRTAP